MTAMGNMDLYPSNKYNITIPLIGRIIFLQFMPHYKKRVLKNKNPSELFISYSIP